MWLTRPGRKRSLRKPAQRENNLIQYTGSSDPDQHVLAGDILSPGSTQAVGTIISDFILAHESKDLRLNQAKKHGKRTQKGMGKGDPPDIGPFHEYYPPYQSADKRNHKHLGIPVNNVQKEE